jgi:general secretion pathway protein B
MSLILDALNKSERERPESGDVPGLQTFHRGGADEQGSPGSGLVWPLLTLVLALSAVGLWLAIKPQPSAPAPAPAPVAKQAPDQIIASPVPVVHVAEVVPEVIPQVMPVATGIVSAPEPQPTVDNSVAALYGTSPTATARPTEVPDPVSAQTMPATTLDVEVLALAAQKALDERAPAEPLVTEHSIPLIANLSQNTKDEIPSLFFSSHRWTSQPGDREVVINNKTWREGDLVKPGLRLTAILEDSIVLDYRGTEFRLNALNSWVNL